MRRRARFGVALAVAALVASLAGSGALSTGSVDRDVAVGVADPGDGYLGFAEPADASGSAGDGTVLLAVTNRFPVPVTATATVREPPGGPFVVRNVTGPGRLAPGETGAVGATVRCGGAEAGRVTVVVRATGDGVAVRTTRRVDVVCRDAGTSTAPGG